MKVLLTGATGFLGRYVQTSLAAQGIETVAVGRRLADPAWSVDLLNPAEIEPIVARAEATHLLHLAWYVEPGEYGRSPLNLRWVETTTRLVDAFCRHGGKKVIVAGTAAEYADSDLPSREDAAPLLPATFYGVAKDATRRLVAATCAHYGAAWVWGRIYLPFGAGEDPQRLTPSLIAALTGKRAPFGVNGSAHRDFIHASDAATALVTLMRGEAQGVYNVCSGQTVQIAALVKELADLLGADPAAILNLTTARPGEPAVVAGDNKKLRDLGWAPAFSLPVGLEKTLTDMGVEYAGGRAKRVGS